MNAETDRLHLCLNVLVDQPDIDFANEQKLKLEEHRRTRTQQYIMIKEESEQVATTSAGNKHVPGKRLRTQ